MFAICEEPKATLLPISPPISNHAIFQESKGQAMSFTTFTPGNGLIVAQMRSGTLSSSSIIIKPNLEFHVCVTAPESLVGRSISILDLAKALHESCCSFLTYGQSKIPSLIRERILLIRHSSISSIRKV